MSENYRMNGEQFHTVEEPLTFSEEKIRLKAAPGEICEGSFTITGAPGISTEGTVVSSQAFMTVASEHFSGSQEVVLYRFDASSLEAGDRVEGYFRIFSNHGEYRLPFRVDIAGKEASSSLGPIHNMLHFTNLARADWKEAVRLFYRPEFADLMAQRGGKEYSLYRGLSSAPGNEQNVEEFLISLDKKSAVEFLPELRELKLDVPCGREELIRQTITVSRNGWGYTHARIRATGAFLRTGEEELSEGSFSGNRAQLELIIDPLRLHRGWNLGEITLSAPFEELTIPVSVRLASQDQLAGARRRQMNHSLLELTEAYIQRRSRKTDGQEWIRRTGEILDQMITLDRNDPVLQLYRIQLYLTEKKSEEARYQLTRLTERFGNVREEGASIFDMTPFEGETEEVCCYRLYLTSLCAEQVLTSPSEIAEIQDRAAARIEYAFKKNPGSWRIGWLLLYISGEYQKKPSLQWKLLAGQYTAGARSPVLYIEAYRMIQLNPAVLCELGEFELSILTFAAKENILTDAVMNQVNYLSQRRKGFSAKLFRILTGSCRNTELAASRRETLTSICSLLIKGNLSGARYFEWFSGAVEEQLQITRLYEYYMLSLPEDFDGELPQIVLMYFAYQNTLPYERSAYLYRYLLSHKDQYGLIYLQYEQVIRRFTQEQLMNGRMSANLEYLYEAYLNSGAVPTPELVQAAVPAIFSCLICTNRTQVRKVIVVYDKLCREQVFRIENGICYLPVYGDENSIFFEDAQGNRYASTVAYTCDRMMDYEKLSRKLSIYDTEDFGFDLYLSGMTGSYYSVSSKNVQHFERLAASAGLSPQYRQEVRRLLLEYYNKNDKIRELDLYLQELEPEGMTGEDRRRVLEYLVLRGQNRKALSWIRKFGTLGLEDKTLVHLCTHYLEETPELDDPALCEIVYEAFRRGKYDEKILKYLNRNLRGLSSELEELRQADLGFCEDTYELSRRMIAQMLYTGEQIEDQDGLLLSFCRQGAPESLLCPALAQRCHYSFIENKPMLPELYEVIGRMGRTAVPILDICRIAWLQDAAQRAGEISGKDLETTTLFLSDLMEQGICFPYFRQFIGILPDLQAYADETLVEYRGGKSGQGRKVIYHYSARENVPKSDYSARQMREMYSGIYVTGFVLFFGEQLYYYITDDPEEKHVVESGTIGQDARIPEESEDRFGRLNRISLLTALEQEQDALSKLESYERTAFYVKKLFDRS